MSLRQVTEALILKTTQYGDTSVVVHAYTRLFGLTAFMARGVRKKGAKIPIALLQPMNLTQIVFSPAKSGTLGHLNETSLTVLYHSIHLEEKKNTIILFVNEILFKSLKEEQPNEALFDYIKDFLITLDEQKEHFSNNHLFFMAGLTHHFGIFPNFEKKGWFDLREGVSVSPKPLHEYAISNEETVLFQMLFSTHPKEQPRIKINTSERNLLLDMLLKYYALHIPGMETVRSRSILHQVLH
jgi:DNA repair protein RecO (recombination protein O)